VNLVEAIRDARAGRKRSVKCPAHNDGTPSLSVGPGKKGKVLLNCLAGCTFESVLAAAGLSKADLRGDSIQSSGHAVKASPVCQPEAEDPTKAEQRAAWPKFIEPTTGDLGQIATLRGLGIEGLRLAVNRGILRVAYHHGHRSWIATDDSRMAAQARRLDGQPFPFFGDLKKALNLPGSIGAWPVGVAALKPEHHAVLVCEGGPDLLAAYHFIAAEGREADASAVALMGASCRIRESELHRFEGRQVRICEQADKAGRDATADWARQLHPHVERLDAIRFDGLRQADGKPVEDLNDLCRIHADDFEANRWTWEVTP
jgi:hypothetical protein